MRQAASLQTVHLGIEAIEDDTLRLVGSQYRAVLEVGSVNFGLMGQSEQEATIAGFAAFLNGLSFPMQMVVRTMPIDVEGYLRDLERRALDLPEDLASLAHDHVVFLRRMARSRTLLERRFYLVVPADNAQGTDRRRWPFTRPAGDVAADAVRRQLTFRCEEIERQLGRCGLSIRRLNTLELMQLLASCWCPELARVQRVQREVADHSALVISAGATHGRRH
ncbi:MAG: hypothetical protein NTZ05_10125 [Chloroflexi bacterium]|nr:hypothetical protein [Chloroflexota bacterium]